MAVDEQELRLLGTLELSLGARQRAAGSISPDADRCRETLAEMIDLERHIDLRTSQERADRDAGRPVKARPTGAHRSRRRAPLSTPGFPLLLGAVCLFLLVIAAAGMIVVRAT